MYILSRPIHSSQTECRAHFLCTALSIQSWQTNEACQNGKVKRFAGIGNPQFFLFSNTFSQCLRTQVPEHSASLGKYLDQIWS